MTDAKLLDELEEWVYAESKRKELAGHLQNPHANHNQRQYLVGFLHSQGASLDDILDLIDRHNHWANYDPDTTQYQAHSVVKKVARRKDGNGQPPEEDQGKDGPDPDTPTDQEEPRTQFIRHLAPFNGAFCKGAKECAIKKDLDNPDRKATFRNVEGKGHTLFVIDIDVDTPDRLDEAWDAARKLWGVYNWWILKFSGKKGFHLIKTLPGKVPPEDLEAKARNLVGETSIDEDLVDWSIYTPNRLIRCVGSPHLGSGLYSVPVDASMSLDDVLNKAKKPLHPDK